MTNRFMTISNLYSRANTQHPRKYVLVLGLVFSRLFLIGCGNTDSHKDQTHHVVETNPEDKTNSDSQGDLFAGFDQGQPMVVENIKELLAKYPKLKQRRGAGHYGQDKKVAFIDRGWVSLKASMGVSLPTDRIEIATTHKYAPAITDHGTGILSGFTSAISGNPYYDPKTEYPFMILYTAAGYPDLLNALEDIIKRGDIDYVVYAQVWEFGGTGDGEGFIEKSIQTVLPHISKWYNAVGNFGKTTYRQKFQEHATQRYVNAKTTDGFIHFRVEQESPEIKIIAATNDFGPTVDYVSHKDFDMELFTKRGRKIEYSTLRQGSSINTNIDRLTGTRHSRERIPQIHLVEGDYKIRIRNYSQNFAPNDEFWVVVSNGPVSMLQESPIDDSIFFPATVRSPKMIRVSANDMDTNSKRNCKKQCQPLKTVAAPSILKLKHQPTTAGSSTATAIRAALDIVLKDS